MICKSTRDMEDKKHDLICDAELLKAGGGEYSANQERASRRGEPAPASPVLNVGVEGGRLIGQAQALSCDDQFAIATAVAANVGCVLGPDAYAASPAPGGESEEEKIARIIFDKTVGVGLSIWRNEFYAGERLGCYKTARTILATLSRPQPGEGVREALDLTAFVLEDAATVLEHVNSEHKAVAEVWRKQVASARRTLSSPAPQSTGERTGRQLDHSITLAGSLALENETMRAMLSRTLALAASNHWRDKAGLSIKAHPLIDEITLFLAGRNLQSTREQKT